MITDTFIPHNMTLNDSTETKYQVHIFCELIIYLVYILINPIADYHAHVPSWIYGVIIVSIILIILAVIAVSSFIIIFLRKWRRRRKKSSMIINQGAWSF